MKNRALFAAVALTVIAITFMLGVAFGRNTAKTNMIPENQTAITDNLHESTQSTISGDGILNINTATKEELILLSGIGEVLAQSIIDYRNENGPFLSVEDLLNVSGIGSKKLDGIKKYITAGG